MLEQCWTIRRRRLPVRMTVAAVMIVVMTAKMAALITAALLNANYADSHDVNDHEDLMFLEVEQHQQLSNSGTRPKQTKLAISKSYFSLIECIRCPTYYLF